MNSPILSIIGPTGLGKTSFVCTAAAQHPFEIISMDSAMVYKELTIGANKPTPSEVLQCPHHIINCISVTEHFDVSQFFEKSALAIQDIISRKKIPIIVGGTMMYANALKEGLSRIPSFPVEDKKNFWAYWADRDLSEAYGLLQKYDPRFAAKVDPSDRQRIIRGLEVVILSDHTTSLSETWQDGVEAFPFKLQWVGLEASSVESHRAVLEDRIHQMIDNGMEDEIEDLYHSFPDEAHNFWKFVAYRQFRRYLEGELTLIEAREQTWFATCRLAKHQRTWMRKISPQSVTVSIGKTLECAELLKLLDIYAHSFSFC